MSVELVELFEAVKGCDHDVVVVLVLMEVKKSQR